MRKSFATQRKIIFAAMSKRNFFLREHIVRFVLNQGHTPTCAFMMFSYFLLDTVDRQALICANNDLIRRSDELWVFGEISSGDQAEIELANQLGMPIKYHHIGPDFTQFIPVSSDQAKIEPLLA